MRKWAGFFLMMMWLVGCSGSLPPGITPVSLPTATRWPAEIPTREPTWLISQETAVVPRPTLAVTDASELPIDPLTGQRVSQAALLERRPLIIKVENLPRADRPQFGLSAADLVYEYYTEEGTSRFIAVYYGQDAERVGPIRSARFFDAHVVRMYKGVFAFGSAYRGVLDAFDSSDFADRLVVQNSHNCPPMCRLDPNGKNILVTNTAQLSQYATQQGMDNRRPDLEGMTFQAQTPAGGQPAPQLVVRYSSAIYNRWEYDAVRGRYMRSVDQENANLPEEEQYAPLVDASNQQPIGAENVVVLFVDHQYVVKTATTEVFNMLMMGSGTAYAARDGQIYLLQWQRPAPDAVLRLAYLDGTPFPFKPGQTWFEVLSLQSKREQRGQNYRFSFVLPPASAAYGPVVAPTLAVLP